MKLTFENFLGAFHDLVARNVWSLAVFVFGALFSGTVMAAAEQEPNDSKLQAQTIALDTAYTRNAPMLIRVTSATNLSACTSISPAAPTVTKGSASPLLTATCSNSPTAWLWKLNNVAITGCATTAPTCIVPAASLPTAGGNYNVTVTANNAGGAGTQAGTATISVSLPPLSSCIAITPVLSNIAPGTAKALVATCNNTPVATGYVWKVQKAGVATPTVLACTGASCTVPGTSLATVGTYTVTVTNNNAGGVGVVAGSATLVVSATPKSDCTAITPVLSNLAPGTAKALVATCNNTPAATGYVWKVQKAGVATPTVLACTGASCTVPGTSLATVGTYTVTATNNNAGGAGNVAGRATITVSAIPKSDCTAITPVLSNIAPGTAKALVATCNNTPVATGYVWKVQKAGVATPTVLACTGASCTVPAASLATVGNYTVTVTNNNAGGAGNVAGRATITVSATPKSDCTAITPAISAITVGSNVQQLTATCNNTPAATGYVWKVQKAGVATPTALACTGASCTVPAASLATAGTYAVTVTNNNAGGAGNVAGRATITVLAQPLSACTAITPSAPSVTLGAASPLLTATCSNSPMSHVWKVGTITLSCTGATCTVPAASLPAAGAYTVTVKANNAAGAGTQAASATVTVTASAAASSLNDTGVTASQCYQAGSDTLVACNSAGAIALNNAQDGMKGRDANAASNGNTDGKLGFSFSSVAGGCVQDNVTGLMWEVKTTDGGLRDWNKTYTNYSAAYNPVSKFGAPSDATGFVAAVNATNLCGYSDWRLPTADELQSIEDYSVAWSVGPTIDASWFPNTPGYTFWSSSPYAGNLGYAWLVDFRYGNVFSYVRDDSRPYVRLVRAGQPSAIPRYTVSANGQEVTDNQTKLIWRRCAEGTIFSGGTCTGTPGTFTHEQSLQRAAAQASSTGIAWRLPDIKEISSIADKSRTDPAIDPTAFPATPPSSWFWSSSPDAYNPSLVWGGNVYDGGVDSSGIRNVSYHVRLVRAGQ